MEPIAGILFILGILVLALMAIATYAKHEEVRTLSPAEEEQYETGRFRTNYASLEGATAITADNVQAVVDDTIETGVEHPLLTARKNESLGQ